MKIYENLKKLVDENSNFFYRDYTTPLGTVIRIFSYHFASYTEWQLPDALECRGISFVMDGEKPVRIASRPMEKFFNLNENPFTTGLDLSKIKYYMEKEDGSLISTFYDGDYLMVKSKASLWSTQAIDAGSILQTSDNQKLYNRCLELAKDGYTCNFEYVSPTNRIVLNYDNKQLILLNVRNNETGEYVPIELLMKDPVLREYLVKVYKINGDPKELLDNIKKEINSEGIVAVMEDGQHFKLKSDWYVSLHMVKSSISNNTNLFEVILSGGSDDIKGLFNDEVSLNKITTFEKIYLQYLKDSIEFINTFKANNLAVDRKTFALKGQTELNKVNKMEIFPVLMNTFNNVKFDFISQLEALFLKYNEKYVPEEYK